MTASPAAAFFVEQNSTRQGGAARVTTVSPEECTLPLHSPLARCSIICSGKKANLKRTGPHMRSLPWISAYAVRRKGSPLGLASETRLRGERGGPSRCPSGACAAWTPCAVSSIGRLWAALIGLGRSRWAAKRKSVLFLGLLRSLLCGGNSYHCLDDFNDLLFFSIGYCWHSFPSLALCFCVRSS